MVGIVIGEVAVGKPTYTSMLLGDLIIVQSTRALVLTWWVCIQLHRSYGAMLVEHLMWRILVVVDAKQYSV